MTDLNQSLDSTIAAIRAQHADEMQACRDRTLAAEVRAELLQSHLTEARQAQLIAERLAVKLVTQFATVEKVFAEAKALALAISEEKPTMLARIESMVTEAASILAGALQTRRTT